MALVPQTGKLLILLHRRSEHMSNIELTIDSHHVPGLSQTVIHPFRSASPHLSVYVASKTKRLPFSQYRSTLLTNLISVLD
jgi:hypothetical protein